MYPAMLRLYSMGYLDTAFLSMRPWTRRAALHALQESKSDIMADQNDTAVETLAALLNELEAERPGGQIRRGLVAGVENAYVRVMANGGGPVLRDSWHLGQSYINDYGRPYGEGFNTYDGGTYIAEWGRFSLKVRGEYQGSAARKGYSPALAATLSAVDYIPYTGFNARQDTIPEGNTPREDAFRLINATVSVHLLNHEISFGKMDNWFGPARGGGMAWSNNADNIYAFRINRVEPLHIPLLSWLIGPVRYDIFLGPLQGHTYPNSPWVHSSMFAFKPTKNLEFSFQRSAIWGGKAHAPITLHTFLHSFFHFDDTSSDLKFSRDDPGARFSAFSFAYRLPFLRRSVTLLLDSTTHDDVTPPSAPRRAGFRTGLEIPQLPFAPKWEARVEAVLTDYSTSRSTHGTGNYYETVQRQGYTNKGFIFGDWIGREGKGGQAWLTYHLSPKETVEFQYRRKKNAKDFVDQGTTQNTYTLSLMKRLTARTELDAAFSYEAWKAPIWQTGQQNLFTGNFQIKWYPRLLAR
ncbi:MAG: capsule assembly Wzi family protein [Acidobacteria bacterium]|nr:capsule assembly Wzi family protein [Acidobacteriota bacterium]